jgi:diguanylate cyclase (GGDEF)-like protein
MKNTPVAGKENKDRVQEVKRLIYIISAPLAVVCLAILWGITKIIGDISWFDLYAIPTLILLILVLFIIFGVRLIPIRFFERSIYILAFIYFAAKTYTIYEGAIFHGSLIESNFILWLPFIYLLGFVLLDIRNALVGSLFFLIITLLYGVFIPLQSSIVGETRHNFILMIELCLSSMFYIIILYLMSRVREHYISYQVLADIMSNLAMTDSLTQVDNRRRLEKYLQEEVNRADRHNLPLAVIMFDIDNFKRINDRYGHASGDLVLVKTAQLIRDNLRSSDHFGRWGGDEFLCVATNTDVATAVHLAERLRIILEKIQILEFIPVTCSFGVTRYARGDSLDVLVRRADLGLFRAKSNGCNQVVTIPPETTLPI